MSKILVTGATGVLGRQLLSALHEQKADVVALSRLPRPHMVVGDLMTGQSLTESLQGITTIIHAASNPNKPIDDLQMTQNLLMACQNSKIEHIVYISIVGVDNPSGYDYFRSKLGVEKLIERSGIPYTIQRATQFHEFVFNLLNMLHFGPLQLAAKGVKLQPVDAVAVARELAYVALADPQGRPADLAGPEVISMVDLARLAGRQPTALPIPHPGLQAMKAGYVIPTAPHIIGSTWQEWLFKHQGQPDIYKVR